MYENFFGFAERPFELVPDLRYLFLSGSHQEALTNLKYGLTARKSVTLLTGEVGTGKTTLLRATLAAAAEQGVSCVHLNTPTLTTTEFTAFLARHFGLSATAAVSKPACHEELAAVLRTGLARNRYAALVVDEAQSLSRDMLEELRLLTNLETDTAKLLPMLLVGQPELAERLTAPEFRNLRQRIALRCTLGALTLEETASYIAARIAIAGGRSATVFTREAVGAIYEASRGLPRAISVLCDNALITGFAAGQRPVGARIVAEVCRDLDLPAEGLRLTRAEAERPAAVAIEPRPGAPVAAAAAEPVTAAVEPAPKMPIDTVRPAAAEPAPPAAPVAAAVAAQDAASDAPVAEPLMFGGFRKQRRFFAFGMGLR